MNKFIPLIICLATVTMVAEHALAQGISAELQQARTSYDAGRLDEIPSTLLKNVNDMESIVVQKDEKAESYRLLVLSYIYLDEPAKADDAMLQLLKVDKEFEPAKNDPAEFTNLWKAYRTTPIFRGTSVTFVFFFRLCILVFAFRAFNCSILETNSEAST